MSEEQTSAQEAQTADNAQSSNNTPSFSVPEAYADRGWASKVQSHDDVWKLLDNSQSLIGKRVAPDNGAPDEQWNEFYKTIGRPESADKYEFPEVDGLPEGFDLTDFNQTAKEVMFEAGLNSRQAQKLYETYLKKELEVANGNKEAMQSRKAELDKEFDEVTNKIFDGKFEEIAPKAQSFIRDNLPPDLLPVIDEISENPKMLASMIALANNAQSQIEKVKLQYGGEDNLNSGGQAMQGGKDEVLKQLIAARDVAKNSDPFSADRKKAEADIQELRNRLSKIV